MARSRAELQFTREEVIWPNRGPFGQLD